MTTSIDRKKILITGVFVVLIIASFWLKSILDKNPDNQTTTEPSTSHLGRVFIKDLHKTKPLITDDNQNLIASKLYTYSSQGTPDIYTGTIRDINLASSEIRGNPSAYFLVDIEPVNITYRVDIVTYSNNTSSVYVTCAPASQQLVKSAECKGGPM